MNENLVASLQRFMRLVVAVVTVISFVGCSFFGPRMQTITISSEPTGATVLVNGSRVGETPLRSQVSRAEDLLIEIRKDGYQPDYRHTFRTMSTLGVLDVIAGCIILVPFLGLLSSAAWKHDPETYGVILSRPTTQDQPLR